MSEKKCKLTIKESMDRRDAIVASSVALMGLYFQGCKTTSVGDESSAKSFAADGPKAKQIKAAAKASYERSCREIWGKTTLSENFGKVLSETHRKVRRGADAFDLKKVHDIVIIGSGYGAACVAARLSENAKPGTSIVVLERGKEWVPGSFPSNAKELTGASSTWAKPWELFNYNFDPHHNLDFVSASGIGGTSLINAGVAIVPHDAVFEQQRWKKVFKSTADRKRLYEQAKSALGVSQSPKDDQQNESLKVQHLKKAHKKVGGSIPFSKLDITLASSKTKNKHGFYMEKCIGCGDCFSGCNVGAKGSVNTTYLATARKNGVRIFNQAQVHSISKVKKDSDEYYRISVDTNNTLVNSDVRAKMVVVAAGTLGTFQILEKSKVSSGDRVRQGHEYRVPFKFSSKLGHYFSGNGDVVGFGVNMPNRVNSGGPGLDKLDSTTRVGPVVESIIDLRKGNDLSKHIAAVDACIPSPVAAPTRNIFRMASSILGNLNPALRDLDKYSFDNGYVFLVLNHDGSDGVLKTGPNGYARATWKDKYGDRPFFKKSNNLMKEIVEGWGGKFMPNVRPSSVHPLGGCSLSSTESGGGSDLDGRVYAGKGNNSVHAGLYVADGSTLPTSTGIHPFLTITAIAEKIAEGIIANRDPKFNFFK